MKEAIEQYKQSGAASLQADLPDLLSRASSEGASKEEMYFVSTVCIDLKKYEKAVTILKDLERRFGLSDVGWNNLALSYWELGQERDAFDAYNRSLALNSENISSLRGACYLAIETDHDEKAVVLCEAFQKRTPDNAESALWYATALHNCGRKEELYRFVLAWQQDHGTAPELEEFLVPNPST